MNAQTQARWFRITRFALAILLGASLVSGCVGGGEIKENDDPTLTRITDPAARRALQRGNPVAAADIYTKRAEKTSDPAQQQDYRLIAAEILFDRGMLEPGMTKLAALAPTMSTPELQIRRDIVQAKAYLYGDDPAAALLALPDPAGVVDPLHQARIYETKALSYKVLQDPDNELQSRIELENVLTDVRIIDGNHTEIWQMLSTLPSTTLESLTTNVRSDVYQGWIELSLANATPDPSQRLIQISQWRERFPEHPANARFLATLDNREAPPTLIAGGEVNAIAVLLPLSDARMGRVAAAVQDGIVVAHRYSQSRVQTPSVRFYDVGLSPAAARSAYAAAIADGANAIIGPLRKEAVAAVVTQRDIPVPTITLNTIDAGVQQGQVNNLIQFGLAPEDEARSAASRAIGLNLTNAIVLQADDSRGDREARAFQQAMYNLGGNVVHVAVLPKDQYDYGKEIKDALLITQSDQRFRSLSSSIGEKLFFEPTIRNDVDVVFLAVGSEQAQSVRPQLDFFYAVDLPRLGTSRIASGSTDLKINKDLNSLYYPGTPWDLRKSLRSDPLRKDILSNFPAAKGVYANLYALGADAFNVATQLDALTSGSRLNGYTGDLQLTADGRIQRYLDWAQYQEGVSVGVERIEAPAMAQQAGASPN